MLTKLLAGLTLTLASAGVAHAAITVANSDGASYTLAMECNQGSSEATIVGHEGGATIYLPGMINCTVRLKESGATRSVEDSQTWEIRDGQLRRQR